MRLITGLLLGGALAAGALGAAVSQTRDPTGAPTPGAAPTAAQTTVPTRRATPEEIAARRAAALAARQQRGGQVDWQAAVGGLRQSGGVGNSLAPNLNQAAVDMTRVPILLPVDEALTAGARIYSFGDYYTITADAPGVGVSLSGTTTVVPLPANTPLKIDPVGPEGVTSQRTVDGQLISFTRYGVLYTVEVRCDAPTDPRCADDNYARGLLAKTTAVVMGAAARAAAGLGG